MLAPTTGHLTQGAPEGPAKSLGVMTIINRASFWTTAIIVALLTVSTWAQTFPETFGVITFSGQGRLVEMESQRPPLVRQPEIRGYSREFLRITGSESNTRFPREQTLNWMVRHRNEVRDTEGTNWTALDLTGFQLHRLKVQGQSRLLMLHESNPRQETDHSGLPLKVTPIGRDHLRLEPSNPLLPGEYALVYQPRSGDATVFCFAVEGPPRGQNP